MFETIFDIIIGHFIQKIPVFKNIFHTASFNTLKVLIVVNWQMKFKKELKIKSFLSRT